MALYSHTTPTGWIQIDTTSSISSTAPTGWIQISLSLPTLPVLSNAGYVPGSISSSGFKPRVTIS